MRPPSPALVLACCATALLWVPFLQHPGGIISSCTTAARLAVALDRDPVRAVEDAFEKKVNFDDKAVRLWQRAHGALVGHLSGSRSVVVGADGWLFYRAERADDGHTLDSLRGDAPLSAGELAAIGGELQRRSAQLAAWGGHLLVVVVPNKESLHPELLPLRYRPTGRPTRLDQLLGELKAHPEVDLLDLKPALAAARHRQPTPLYFKLDTHWNAFGRHLGYQAIIAHLGRRHPGLAPTLIPDQDFRPAPLPPGSGDLLRTLSAGAWVPPGLLSDQDFTPAALPAQDWHVVTPMPPGYATRPPAPGGMRVPWDQADTYRLGADTPQAPWRVTVLHDSLGGIPRFARHFAEVTYRWTHAWDDAALERERPDLVIHVLGERYLDILDPRFSRLR